MIYVLACIVVDIEFERRLCQIKDYKISIYCFSVKHTELGTRKEKQQWLVGSESEQVKQHFYMCGLLLQSANIIQVQLSMLG